MAIAHGQVIDTQARHANVDHSPGGPVVGRTIHMTTAILARSAGKNRVAVHGKALDSHFRQAGIDWRPRRAVVR